jgi:hypothetical protein
MGCGPISHTSTGPMVLLIADVKTPARVIVTLDAPEAGNV